MLGFFGKRVADVCEKVSCFLGCQCFAGGATIIEYRIVEGGELEARSSKSNSPDSVYLGHGDESHPRQETIGS